MPSKTTTTLGSKEDDRRARLEKLTVKELRHEAAICDVPLTRIAMALEKQELISMIMTAGPVLDQYDVQYGAKVHSASSIKSGVAYAKPEKKKKEKKQKKKRDSSSSSSSGGKGKKRKRSRSRKKKDNRSPSLEMMALPAPSAAAAGAAARKERRAKAMKAALALPSRPGEGVAPAKAVPAADLTLIDSDDEKPAKQSAPAEKPKSLAEAGMEAVMALGFQVLPKEKPSTLFEAGPGLRPSYHKMAPANAAAYASTLQPGARICMQYLTMTRCDLGANCPEAHIIDPEEEMKVRARFKMQECHAGATCNRSGCLFRHPGERLEENLSLTDGLGPSFQHATRR